MELDILELLKQYGYVVKVRGTDKGCVMHVPPRVIQPISKERKIYYIRGDDKVYIKEGKRTKDLWVPKYAQRTAIYLYIAHQCLSINYDTDFIDFERKNGQKGKRLTDILPADFEDSENIEQPFMQISSELLGKGVMTKEITEKGRALNILEGLEIIHNNFGKGKI